MTDAVIRRMTDCFVDYSTETEKEDNSLPEPLKRVVRTLTKVTEGTPKKPVL